MIVTRYQEPPNLPLLKNLKESLKEKARISNFMEILKEVLSITEWDLYDPKEVMNGPFESYLIEKALEFTEGKPLDLNEMYKSILEAGQFSQKEKRMFQNSGIEEIIWTIMLVVTNIKIEND